jgi:hypothetical protein
MWPAQLRAGFLIAYSFASDSPQEAHIGDSG